MNKLVKPKGYWGYDIIKAIALNYDLKKDFNRENRSAYEKARKMGWIPAICSHMIGLRKANGYWDKIEIVHNEALKYKSRLEFSIKSCSAYCSALRHNWVDKVCSHMEQIGNIKNRMIYAYEFSDNTVYVGLTCNSIRRNEQHLGHEKDKRSAVTKYIEKTKMEPLYVKISNYIDVEKAILLEAETVENYKNNGWNVLNQRKTGGIGNAVIKWTEQAIKKEAIKHERRVDFRSAAKGAYERAYQLGILDTICSHMETQFVFHTKETCQAEALKYNQRVEFQKGCKSAYSFALRNGINDEVCSHMKSTIRTLTPEYARIESRKYSTTKDFYRADCSLYQYCRKNKLLEEIQSHMIKTRSKK